MSATLPVAAPSKATGWLLDMEAVQRWGALIVAGLALVIATLTFAPQLDPQVDSADYIVLGQALRAGLGMRYIHLPEAPTPNRLPVGFPLLLAGIEWVAPNSVIARKVLVAACYVGAVILTFRLAAAYIAPRTAFLVTVLTALNPFVLGMARLVMSELPYLLVSLLALWLLERALEGPGQGSRGAWIGGVAALLVAPQLRTIGWSLLLALVVVLLLRRRYRTLTLVLVGCGLAVGLMILAGVRPIESRYLEIWEERMTGPEASGIGEAAKSLRRIGASAFHYGYFVIPATFLPMPVRGIPLTAFKTLPPIVAAAAGAAWRVVPQALLVSLCLLALALGAWPSLRGLRLAPYYAGAFLLVLCLWPPEFSWARMVVPIIPCLLLFGAIGLQRLWTWARPRTPALHRCGPALVGAMILAQVYGSVSLGVLARDGWPQWSEFLEMAKWIRTHTDPHDLILTDFPAHLYILTERRADFLFRRRTGGRVKMFNDFEQLLRHIDQTDATYLVDDGLLRTTRELRRRLFVLAAQPGSHWKVAYRGRGNGVYVRSQ